MRFFFLFLFALFPSISAYGFDLKGVQPVAPNGVFSTFSTESLKKGASGVRIEAEKSIKPDFNRFTAHLAYGVTDNIEINIAVPYVTQEFTTNGFEDIALELKHRFFDEGRYGPSIAYSVNISLPTGNDEYSTEGSLGGGIIMSKRLGPLNSHANIFYSRPGTRRFKDDLTVAAGVDFSAARNFKILGELYGKKSYAGSLDRLEARFGYRVQNDENIFTTVGFGVNTKNPEYRVMVSLTYLFLRPENKAQKIYEPED